ncbi:CotH kinase family protein [uncultured Oscillibacter sp.]|uniref:CotH kinase family protein n=1 Tax=uncultured Oscillibacter sp. TaxID=876091 RepID=UPI0026019F0B|nr:CotH kinase family protein [uncultured Oscillibacter sp.]
MSTHKYMDRLCAAALALTLLATLLFMNGESLGLQPAFRVMGYETRLFDTGRVHTLDIVMDDWDGFIETCENEEYASCSVVIDGESYHNVGIRAKGNTSLSMVSAMDSSRYSFKLEFDHYDSTRTYYGLDKLSLNNIIQDTTYMKDYLTYQLMNAFGAAAPLSSYIYITVNGEDWGLYLAAEGVEDGFLRRNYGKDAGELYKPDSMSFGGGRGNGRNFNMDDFPGDRGGFPSPPEESGGFSDGFPDGFPGGSLDGSPPPAESGAFEKPPEEMGGGRGFFSGGMGSDDVKLRYIDDDPASYSNIFENAKTDVTEADQARLIASLKALSAGENLEEVLDIDQVLRYFVVHNFVRNGDSYTGSMVHNYYLYEKDGQLSMIPWDYNLAFGTFQSADATAEVNAPIDTPVSGGDSRPMSDWMFDSPEYTELYHQYFRAFLETVDAASIIDAAAKLIAPYVEKDPTKFYSYEDFETGVETLKAFCRLRSESVMGQLDGSIPSTEAGQSANASALVDASGLVLTDMGTMNRGGAGMEGQRGEMRRPGDDGLWQAAEGSEALPLRGTDPPGGAPPEAFPSASPDGLLPLGVSGAALLAGLAFAWRFRRRG